MQTAGFYDVKFAVVAQNPNQVTLYLNGSPVAGGTYGIDTGNTTNYGHVLVTIPANGVLTLRNYLTAQTAGNITLKEDPGGNPAVPPTAINASILIEKIG